MDITLLSGLGSGLGGAVAILIVRRHSNGEGGAQLLIEIAELLSPEDRQWLLDHDAQWLPAIEEHDAADFRYVIRHGVLTAADIQNMSLDEYARHRPALHALANDLCRNAS